MFRPEDEWQHMAARWFGADPGVRFGVRLVKRSATALLGTALLIAAAAGCNRTAPVAFPVVSSVTSVIVNNARGAYHPQTVRDPSTISQLVAIMARYSDGWSAKSTPGLGAGDPPKCAYGIGFYTNGRWVAGVSIESDGTTVARSQFGTTIFYKSNTTMGGEMLAAVHRTI
jgi:hypothetical protein